MCRITESRWSIVPGLILLGGLAMAIDVRAAALARQKAFPEELGKLCSLSETFADGIGVLMCMTLLFVLDPPRRIALPRIAAAAFGAGLAANIIKLLVARTRPDKALLDDGVWATFAGILPGAGAGTAAQSFPSAHMATAMGFAIALAWLYPRGRWLFFALAILAGGQRILAAKHYVSDVCWGAALGFFIGTACVYATPLSRWFDRLEESLARRRSVAPYIAAETAMAASQSATDPRAA